MADNVAELLRSVIQTQKNLGKSTLPLSAKTLFQFLQYVSSMQAKSSTVKKASSKPLSKPTEILEVEQKSVETQQEVTPIRATLELISGSKEEQWQWLKNRVLSDPVCLQHLYPGKKLVVGSGNLNADIFFCGEAPGADEEEQGEVFVGRAGQLLTKIINAMGLQRSDVYIGNIMNWRPETPNHIGNRPPTQEEMNYCLPFLKAQVDIVKPKVIVALGATAVSGLLGYDSQRKMRDCRGNWYTFNQIPLLVTYHPSYLLRNATNAVKRIVWEDLLQVMKFLKMPISDKQKTYFL